MAVTLWNWLQRGKTFCDFAFRVLTDCTGHPLFSWQMPTCLTNLSLSRSKTVNKEKRDPNWKQSLRLGSRPGFYFEGEQFLVLVCVISCFTPSQSLVSEYLQTAAATKAITRFWVWPVWACMSEVSESLHIIINSTSFIHNCPIELLIYYCCLQITALTIRIMIIIYLQSQSLYQFFFFLFCWYLSICSVGWIHVFCLFSSPFATLKGTGEC